MSGKRGAPPAQASSSVVTRTASLADLGPVLVLESKVFASDRMSRRSVRRFLVSPHAVVLVADVEGCICGAAVVLVRCTSDVARLYSIAVDPDCAGRGVGCALLAAAEDAASARDCLYLRLEVHENNARAIALYRKTGYREFGRLHEYYLDRGHALRFEKRLSPQVASLARAPPYFHQTTEFTCGPACLLMALAWGDRAFTPSPAMEFRLWREATTIFMSNGLGGCEPFGMAVALKRRGLSSEIFVSRPGPYFLDTVRSAEKRRVMRIAQEDFVAEAKALGLPVHLTNADESVAMPALDAGAAAIVLVSDGADTASDATLPSLQRLLLQSDVFLYAIGIDAPDARSSTRINPWPLRELSAEGGGYTEIIHDSAELVPATARIADELNHQYMLGYSPSHAGDGQFHTIRVFVKGEGDYQIRARRGYLARGSRSL